MSTENGSEQVNDNADPLASVTDEDGLMDAIMQQGETAYADLFDDPKPEPEGEFDDDQDDDETKVIDVDAEPADDKKTPDATKDSASDDAEDSGIPPELMAQAEAMGISREDAEATPISVLSRMVQMSTANVQDQPPAGPKTNGPLDDGRTEDEVWDSILGDESELLPEMKFALGALRGQFNELRAIKEHMVREENARAVDRVNVLFNDVSTEFGKTFDSSNDAGMRNRIAVLQRMDSIRAEAIRSGKTPPSEADLFRQAVDSKFGAEGRKAAEKRATDRVKAQLRRRQGNQVSVPGAADRADGGDATVSNLQRKFAEVMGHSGAVAPLSLEDLII